MPCPNCHKSPAPKKKRMSASSCKAKGRRLQQFVRDELRRIAPQLDPTDIESTPMGCNGVDVILTKAARAVFGELAIEAKNVEVLNAVGVFQGHVDKYQLKGQIPIMVHSRNHIDPRVTMLWSDWIQMFTAAKRLGVVMRGNDFAARIKANRECTCKCHEMMQLPQCGPCCYKGLK